MAEKRMNRLLYGGIILAVGCLLLVVCSERQDSYATLETLPSYDTDTKRKDGDTQADTIKALQAYAREAVSKADALHERTESRMEQVLTNQQKVIRLEKANQDAEQTLADHTSTVESLQQQLLVMRHELDEWQADQATAVTPFNIEGLPLGFGFDESGLPVRNRDQGTWYESIDQVTKAPEEGDDHRFSGLFSQSPRRIRAAKSSEHKPATKPDIVIEPIYTLPKDTTLTDALALTALIGRIPVQGQTPDPYPIKIYIGRENLLANGHDMPEVEGMIFSGLGFGDWNLSCVSARLMSATFIFKDGTIVNHSSQGKPLGYISDPSGVPCVAGRFVTNAPAFLSQRVGLAGLGAAGAAYAEAQQQRQTSSLTGSTTSTVVGDIHKLVAGEAVQSATHEVSQWLLARQQQSFDAVVVDPGAVVSVHLDYSLSLDKSSIARKLRYAKTTATDHHSLD